MLTRNSTNHKNSFRKPKAEVIFLMDKKGGTIPREPYNLKIRIY